MNRRRMRMFFKLSLLMLIMGFLNLVTLLVVLFFLTFRNAFVCDNSTLRGFCTLSESYNAYNFVIIANVAAIIICLILASYFQQFFLESKKPKKTKAAKKKEKPAYTALLEKRNLSAYDAPSMAVSQPVARAKKTTKPHPEPPRQPDADKPTLEPPQEKVTPYEQAAPTDPTVPIKDTPEAVEESIPTQEAIPAVKRKRIKLKKRYSSLPSYDAPPLEVQVVAQMQMVQDAIEMVPIEDIDLKETVPLKSGKDEPMPSKRLIVEEAMPPPVKPDKIITKKKSILEKTEKRRTFSHTKEDISLVIESLTTLTREEARVFLDHFTEIIAGALINRDKVAIHNFGTFTTSELKSRTMNVPTKDEETTEIPSHHVIRFKASPAFEEYMNNDTAVPIAAPEPAQEPRKETTTPRLKKSAVVAVKALDEAALTERISEKALITRKEATLFLEALTNIVTEQLSAGQKVAIHQFGTFDTTVIQPKTIKIPTSETPVFVEGYKNVNFKPSPVFTDAVNPLESEKNNK